MPIRCCPFSPSPTLSTGQWYDLEIVISGNTATLKVGGVRKVSHTFAGGIQGGQACREPGRTVGLRVSNAHTHFKEATLKTFVNVTR